MRNLFAAAALVSAVSLTSLAVAQAPKQTATFDARSLASDQDVAEARRYYRAQCAQEESAPFCDCVTAGVAQTLMPAEVRIAANTIGERINAQGDAMAEFEASPAESSAERIERVEAHYAAACAQFRG